MLGSELWGIRFDGLLIQSLVKQYNIIVYNYMCGKYESIKCNDNYDSDSGYLVNNFILSLHLGKGMLLEFDRSYC